MEAPIKIPNFDLDKEIGRGGMSRVYLARQLEPKRKVAIKIVAPGVGADDGFLDSLKHEGDTIAGMSCDNIVTVYACGVIDKHYYLCMEILAGGDLTERIKKGMRPDDVLTVMLQIGNALQHAHSKGVLHRDIKPENVMVHESGKAVLVDFGIAKDSEKMSSFTQMGAVVGTPHYMSPERCMGKPTDHRSDLYAMGVMFFEMLTGHKLYEGRDTYAVSYAHVYEPVPPLPTEHARFQAIINKLLAKDPDERVQTAAEMIEGLKRAQAGMQEPATRRLDTTANKLAAGESTVVSTPIPGRGLAQQATEIISATSRPAPQASQATPAVASKNPWLVPALIGGIAVLGATYMFTRPTPPVTIASPEDIGPRKKLNVEEATRVRDLLQAGETQLRLQNTDVAEDNFTKALEIDCTDPEARAGLKALNRDKTAQVIAACTGFEVEK